MKISTHYSGINLPDVKYSPAKKRSKHHVKRFKLKYFFRWLRKEPVKFIAYISAVALIYVTCLFVQFARAQHKNGQNFNVSERSANSISR